MGSARCNLSCALLLFFLFCSLTPRSVLAATYSEALAAYSDQKFAKCYRIAMDLADRHAGENDKREAKSLILAAASALELNKEQKAIKLYHLARESDSRVDLPKVVKSKRVISFFEDVRHGKTSHAKGKGTIVEVVSKSAFDHTDVETYYPLGINQFQQGKTLSGLAFGGLQVFGLYYAYQQSDKARRTDRALMAKTAQVIQTGDYETSAFRDFRDASKKASARFRTESNLALATTLLAYGASIVEILSNPPTRLKVVDNVGSSAMSPRQLFSHISLGARADGQMLLGLNLTLP
ncbi:MAG TPA: hypothetical protein VFO10_01355 [Oligoflexus sp.]|uniref:hypothetical protein n=1 Tax=Oligoflexus sp. TaxID=1971216 RepID=UPI002D7F3A4B|nr:hypothetical protein [Oligoflexus sp.]HET9235864.1 hypothetical protein [Oligoflexus sp.]